ncbi:unnamed protein product, partial [Pylaiella littoralis]
MHATTIMAEAFGRLLVVKTLLATRADVNMTGTDGATALHNAAKGGHDGIVAYLLDTGAKAFARNNPDATRLMAATQEGHLPVVKTFMAARVDVNIVTSTSIGFSALYGAAQEGHNQVSRALLRGGADKNATEASHDTPLRMVTRAGHLPVMDTLLETSTDL